MKKYVQSIKKLFNRSHDVAKHKVVDRTELFPSWFDPSAVNATLMELQTAVSETSKLVSSITSQLEDRLQVTQAQLSTIVHVVTEGIIILDDAKIIHEWNDGAEIIFGYTKQEMIGRSFKDLLNHCTSGQKQPCFCGTSLSDVSSRSVEGITKAGDRLYLEISVNPYPLSGPSGDSSKQNYVIIIRDVTLLNEAQDARDYERRVLNTIVNTSSDVIIVRDYNGRWIKINDSTKQLYQFEEAQQYIGLTTEQIAKKRPLFAQQLESSSDADKIAWVTKSPVRTEVIIPAPSGDVRYFDVIRTPIFSDDGEPEVIVIRAHEITQTRRAHEYVEAVYRALSVSPCAVVIFDKTGHVAFRNAEFERMFGVVWKLSYGSSTLKQMGLLRYEYVDLVHKLQAGLAWNGTIHVPTDDSSSGVKITDVDVLPVDTTLSQTCSRYYVAIIH